MRCLVLLAAVALLCDPPTGVCTAATLAHKGRETKQSADGPTLSCKTGPARRLLAGQPWTIHSCSDHATLLVTSAEGNPALPFVFFLVPSRNGYEFATVTTRVPPAANAARIELLSFTTEEMAELIRETEGGMGAAAPATPAPPPASGWPDPLPPTSSTSATVPTTARGPYEEERIGAWTLRTDRRARTVGVIWMNTGVIELAARSADGEAR